MLKKHFIPSIDWRNLTILVYVKYELPLQPTKNNFESFIKTKPETLLAKYLTKEFISIS